MGDSSDSYNPPLPPGAMSSGRKKKKKHSARLITSYRLPRLDEMVLLQPISTRADGSSKFERTRVENIHEHLETYNRWLAFLPAAKPGRAVRNAAVEMQQSVHELNAIIADVMIQVDRKIADLQDRTEDFVAAVQEGGTWQTKGDLLGIGRFPCISKSKLTQSFDVELTFEELDAILEKHPDRNTESYGRHLCQTIRNTSPPPAEQYAWPNNGGRFLDKLLRLIKDVEACPEGIVNAFHLLIYVKTDLLGRLRNCEPFGSYYPSRKDYERIDSEAIGLVRRSTAAVYAKRGQPVCTYFKFAGVCREVTESLPRWCRSCNWSPSPPHDPFSPFFPSPRQSCLRAPHLSLLDKVQKWAYSEVKFGVMLLGKRLPREICLLVFEFTMEAEKVPLDPRVWNEDEYLVGMCIRGGLKSAYTCTTRSGRGLRDSLDDLSSFDL